MRRTAQKSVLAVVALGALVVWFWLRSDKPPASPSAKAAPGIATKGPVGPLPAIEQPVVPLETPQESLAEVASVRDGIASDPNGQVQDALRRYREFTVYPPWSRPFADNTTHYAEWNQLKPEGQPFAVDESGRELMVEVTLDRMFAGPGEPIRATVKAGRMADGRLQPAALLVAARIERSDPANGFVLVRELLLDQSGPEYSTQFVPSEHKELAENTQEAMVTVEVRKGAFFKTIRMPFQYAATLPMRVLGIRSDTVVNGSLAVDLEVDVVRVAPTLLRAVLYDRAGRIPIAIYDDYFRPTMAGRQSVTMTFFGKVLKEKNVNGPYSIRALHGVSKNLNGADLYWKYNDDPILLTSMYAAGDFSGAEWESAEKREKIAQYEDMLRVVTGLRP